MLNAMIIPETQNPCARFVQSSGLFRYFVLLFLLLGCLPIQAAEVEYYKHIKGYLAEPEGDGEHPAIILIHEWWGLNADIRSKADAFADEGYTAFAVDLYNGAATKRPKRARELATAVRNDMENAFANLRAAVAYVKSLPRVQAERLASVGWCFGGGWSYRLAKNNLGVAASIIYYGYFNPEDDLSRMRTTILGHFAENDRGILLDNVKSFSAKLKTLGGNHAIFIYPNTGHGFANPDNSVYDAEAAALAAQRTLEFLSKHL